MEKLLNGILVSPYPNNLKRALASKVIENYKPPDDHSECFALLELGARFLQQGISELEIAMGEMLLNRFARLKPAVFSSYFSGNRLAEYLDNISFGLENIFDCLRVILTLKDTGSVRKDCALLSSRIAAQLKETAPGPLQIAMANLFLAVPLTRPSGLDIADVNLKWLTKVSAATPNYDIHVSMLAGLLVNLWDNREDKTLQSLMQLFSFLSQAKGTTPYGLASILQNVPSKYIPVVSNFISNLQNQVKDHELEVTLLQLMKWPLSVKMSQWIIGFLNALCKAKRFSVMTRIVARTVPIAVNQMYLYSLRTGAFAVLEHMLYGYQHSPDIFHLLLPQLKQILMALQQEIGETVENPQEDKEKEKEDRSDMTVDSKEEQQEEVKEKETKQDVEVAVGKEDNASAPEPEVKESQRKRQKIEAFDADIDEHTSIQRLMGVQVLGLNVIRSLLTLSSTDEGVIVVTKQPPLDERGLAITKDVVNRLCCMLHTLIFHHTGYPELYGPLIALMAHHPAPSDEEMRTILSTQAWTKESEGESSGGMLEEFSAKPSSVGKAGLVNLGNTCYMNSFLQALFMTDPLRIKLSPLPPQTWFSSDRQLMTLAELQRVFVYLALTARKAYSPKAFLKVLPSWFRPGVQQDSSEFGKFLMDAMETEAQNTLLKGLITDLFGGIMANSITCNKCHSVSRREEPYTDISLSFDGTDAKRAVTLEGLIESFLSPELLEGDNKYFCDHCSGLQEAEKKSVLVTSPEHLILTLKRFAYDPKTNERTKVMNEVVYPLLLSVPIDSTSVSPSENEKMNVDSEEADGADGIHRSDMYSLYAVIMHSGTSAHHGHYYCYARHSQLASAASLADDPEDKCWYMFNDSFVDRSKFVSFSTITKKFNKDVAYILFYRKKNMNATSNSGKQEASDEVLLPRDSEINTNLSQEVIKDNSLFLVEQENYAKRARQRAGILSAYTRGLHPGFRDDDEDDQGGRNCGRKFDGDLGGRGGFGGDMPRFVN